MSEQHVDREEHSPAGEVDTAVADEISERPLDREDPPAGEVHTAVADDGSERHMDREDHPPAAEMDTAAPDEMSEPHLDREDPPAGEVDTTTVADDVTHPAAPPDGQRSDSAEEPFELFSASDIVDLRRRWDALQIGFVDDPAASLQQADSLVSEVAQRVADRHATLREEFSARAGDQPDTESARLLLRRHRAFFRALVP